MNYKNFTMRHHNTLAHFILVLWSSVGFQCKIDKVGLVTTPPTNYNWNNAAMRIKTLFRACDCGSVVNIAYSEYQIPGTPRPGQCHFTYRSNSRLEGRFNSPRHPQNYPNHLNCTYVFLATPSQQVYQIFTKWKLDAWFINSRLWSETSITS